MPSVPPDVLAYYESGRELGRLDDGELAGPLEYARTIELLQRFLPSPPGKVLDVGGGPGAYSAWLVQQGYSVRLVDPVHRHVEAAQARGIDAVVGEAAGLDHDDRSVDVVLLMGPLYHLVDRNDRLRALQEAHRVLRPGGLVAVTAISRFAALCDQLIRLDQLHDPDELRRMEEIVRTGVLPGRDGAVFTTAYLHLPRELIGEIAEAGFVDRDILSVEGPGYLVGNFDERWADEERRRALLAAARLVERDPEFMAIGSHLMAVARRAGD